MKLKLLNENIIFPECKHQDVLVSADIPMLYERSSYRSVLLLILINDILENKSHKN